MEIPVLTYHNLSHSTQKVSPYFVSVDDFRFQMSYLKENNYLTITISELYNIIKTNDENELRKLDKAILITFDDGYENNYHLALPVLMEMGLNATFFVIPSKIDNAKFLSWKQLKKMNEWGMDIQSHTFSHTPLTSLDQRLIRQELIRSKEIIEHKLNISVNFLSYPHGVYNEHVIQTAKETNYWGGCTSNVGYFNITGNFFEINRIDIRKNYDQTYYKHIIDKNERAMKKIKLKKYIKKRIELTIGIENYNKLYNTLFKSTQ